MGKQIGPAQIARVVDDTEAEVTIRRNEAARLTAELAEGRGLTRGTTGKLEVLLGTGLRFDTQGRVSLGSSAPQSAPQIPVLVSEPPSDEVQSGTVVLFFDGTDLKAKARTSTGEVLTGTLATLA